MEAVVRHPIGGHDGSGTHPGRNVVEVLVRLRLEHVALRLVKRGDAGGVLEESCVAPMVQKRKRDRLRGAGGLQVRVARVQVDDVDELLRSGEEAEAHACEEECQIQMYLRDALAGKRRTRGQDLGERVEADDASGDAAFALLDLKVARGLVGRIEVQEMVRIILEDEQVVLASERKDLDLALERARAPCRV